MHFSYVTEYSGCDLLISVLSDVDNLTSRNELGKAGLNFNW